MTSGERVDIVGAGGVRLAGERWLNAAGVEHKGHILLLHGGGQTRHSWAATGQRLAHRGWTTIAMDARGHGDSGWATDDAGYRVDAMVEDLGAVTAQIGEPPVVLGASMGGIAALVAEGEIGGLLRALVLVDITPTVEPEGVAKITAFMRSGLGGFSTLEEAAGAVAQYTPNRARPVDLDGLRKNLRLRSDGRWHWHWDPAVLGLDVDEAFRGTMRERLRAAAARVRIPTLLVRGSASDVVSSEGARELLNLIPGARLVEVPQAGHMVAGDDNDTFTVEVEDFLDGLTVRMF